MCNAVPDIGLRHESSKRGRQLDGDFAARACFYMIESVNLAIHHSKRYKVVPLCLLHTDLCATDTGKGAKSGKVERKFRTFERVRGRLCARG